MRMEPPPSVPSAKGAPRCHRGGGPRAGAPGRLRGPRRCGSRPRRAVRAAACRRTRWWYCRSRSPGRRARRRRGASSMTTCPNGEGADVDLPSHVMDLYRDREAGRDPAPPAARAGPPPSRLHRRRASDVTKAFNVARATSPGEGRGHDLARDLTPRHPVPYHASLRGCCYPSRGVPGG